MLRLNAQGNGIVDMFLRPYPGYRFLLFALPLTCLVMWASAAFAADVHKAGDLVIEPVTLTTPDTGPVQLEMGTFYVPENRNNPKSRIIAIGFARFRALQPTGAPPQFHLPGGPGSSLLNKLKPDSKDLATSLKSYVLYRRAGDVVLVDQRGNSERGEVLKFARPLPPEPLDKPASIARSMTAIKDATRATLAEHRAKGVDLRGYNVLECADDVNDLRKALGYERIMLVATSFGSQWSFAIMRRHPDMVARALLSGIEPLNYSYDMPSHVLAAIERMWFEAEQDPKLQPYLPPGGFMGAADEIGERLSRAPAQVKVTDEKTGQTHTVALGIEDFREWFVVNNNKPVQLLSIYYGHYDTWAKRVAARRQNRHTEGTIIRPLIDTSLGVTQERLYLLRNDEAQEFLGHWNFEIDVAAGEICPSPDVGDDFRTEVISRIPVVFVQGDWDTSTPIENTYYVAAFFPNSRIVITTRGPHEVLPHVAKDQPDVFAALLDFLLTGNMENLPARTILPRPDFGVPNFPPPASATAAKSN